MTNEPNFTMGDLLQQLAEEFGYSINNDSCSDAYTSTELCELLSMSKYKVMKILKEKHKRGEIEIVEKIIECFGSGRMLSVNAYRLKRGEENVRED